MTAPCRRAMKPLRSSSSWRGWSVLALMLATVGAACAPGGAADLPPAPSSAINSGGNGGGILSQGGMSSEVIPADRLAAWQPGIPGGIRTPSVLCATVDPSYGNGTTDASRAIQDAVNHCDMSGRSTAYVWIPAGTYVLKSKITMSVSGVVLQGDRLDTGETTVLRYEGPADGVAIEVGNSWFHNDAFCDSGGTSIEYCDTRKYVSITDGMNKDSTVITVNDASGIAVGDVLLIDEKNSPQFVDATGADGLCTACGRAGGQRVVGQFVEVTAKDGNSVTIDPPLYWTFTASQLPEASIIPNAHVTRSVGIQDLKITQASALAKYLIYMHGTVQSFIQHVDMEGPYSRAIWMPEGLRNVVRDSYIHNAVSGFSRPNGYGIMLDGYQTATLIENNVLDNLGNFIMTAGGASGNVIAYNYLGTTHTDDCETSTDACRMAEGISLNHAPHPHMNLWEGNCGSQIGADFVYGSSSHNTVFRNRSTGWQAPKVASQQPWNYNAVNLDYKNTYVSFVGNVLGTPGRPNTYELAYPAPSDATRVTIWRFGFGAPDPTVSPFDEAGANGPRDTIIRHGNWDACSAVGTAQCADAPGGAVNGTVWNPNISTRELPASLYLAEKPFWFGDLPWPPFGPDVTGFESKLPAQLRLEQGKP